ncbi:MAG TPA: hypothetical protein VEQ60_32565 [Longimicrobium sp.]|nr:hypothetical protein [Longimicrobium sp.]
MRQFQEGVPLSASADTPGRPGIRQTVIVHPAPPTGARVHVEHYLPNEWDTNQDEAEHMFSSLDEALEWLERECAVHWSQLSGRV